MKRLFLHRLSNGLREKWEKVGTQFKRVGDLLLRRVVSVSTGELLEDKEIKKHYPFLLFLSVLGFLYIANSHTVHGLLREESRLKSEVKELRSLSLSFSARRIKATRQSYIMEMIEQRGLDLKVVTTPHKVIKK